MELVGSKETQPEVFVEVLEDRKRFTDVDRSSVDKMQTYLYLHRKE